MQFVVFFILLLFNRTWSYRVSTTSREFGSKFLRPGSLVSRLNSSAKQTSSSSHDILQQLKEGSLKFKDLVEELDRAQIKHDDCLTPDDIVEKVSRLRDGISPHGDEQESSFRNFQDDPIQNTVRELTTIFQSQKGENKQRYLSKLKKEMETFYGKKLVFTKASEVLHAYARFQKEKDAKIPSPKHAGKATLTAYTEEAEMLRKYLSKSKNPDIVVETMKKELESLNGKHTDCNTGIDVCNRLAYLRVFKSESQDFPDSKAEEDDEANNNGLSSDPLSAFFGSGSVFGNGEIGNSFLGNSPLSKIFEQLLGGATPSSSHIRIVLGSPEDSSDNQSLSFKAEESIEDDTSARNFAKPSRIPRELENMQKKAVAQGDGDFFNKVVEDKEGKNLLLKVSSQGLAATKKECEKRKDRRSQYLLERLADLGLI